MLSRIALWFLGYCLLGASASIAAPNFVVIMTDDQRWDTLWAMPHVQEKLIRRGVHFTQAIVSSPLCCPSRASFLAGGFQPQHTGVLDNILPNGGVTRFAADKSLPLHLQRAGYATALIGKYLNGYRARPKAIVPQGWSYFFGLTDASETWLAAEFVTGSSTDMPTPGSVLASSGYLTDILLEQGLAFLDSVGTQPFFLYFAPFAPHYPAIPAAQDAAMWDQYQYRSRGYAEPFRTDKPLHVQNAPLYNAQEEDEFHRQQLRSLQAVDRAVDAIMDRLGRLGVLHNTVVVYMSDNGYLWGEHGATGKIYPYQESLRVPLVVRMPGILPREDAALVVANLDIPATIQALAALPPHTEGHDLRALLDNPRTTFRADGALIASFHDIPNHIPLWRGWVTTEAKYIEYGTGETELYDLRKDPYELVNRANHVSYAPVRKALAAHLGQEQGLAITSTTLPSATVGHAYTTTVVSWGGIPPYTWTLTAGTLPPGLSLVARTGQLLGTPTQAGVFFFTLTVDSAAMALQAQAPQIFHRAFLLVVL